MAIYKKPPKRSTGCGSVLFGICVLIMACIGTVVWIIHKPLSLATTITVAKGDTFTRFVSSLPTLDEMSIKIYAKIYDYDMSKIQLGSYQFSGTYTKQQFLETIQKGPEQDFVRYTVLEGWSIYDIDYDLTRKGLIQAGDYIAYVTDTDTIQSAYETVPFLRDIVQYSAISLPSLEGFLYPDTYFVDDDAPVIPQLVRAQLRTFATKMQQLSVDRTKNLPTSYAVQISPYQILILASIVEKEERNTRNQPTVVGIFLHRIQKNMRLDADITLCYGLQQPYETCTPSVIAREIYNTTNPFNTRQQMGIPSQPIANPSLDAIRAVLEHQKTSYLYYLHDMQGKIYYGSTLAEHNQNKRLYLK